MNETEQHASDALPLALAAARLGISPDALRMRINRGKIKGFKRSGRLFAVLGEAPNQAQGTAQAGTEQTTPDRFERTRDRPATFRGAKQGRDRAKPRGQSTAPKNDAPPLPLVVEFQKVELSRLLRDNSRLNQRLDQLIDELRHLREMQQREQVLRQQEQALRQRTQAWIERLTAPPVPAPPASAQPALTPPVPGPASFAASMSGVPMSAASMSTPPATAPPATAPPAAALPMSAPPASARIGPEVTAPRNVAASPDAGSSVSAARPESAVPDDVPEDSATKAGDPCEAPNLSREDSASAYGEDATPPELLGESGESGETREGARRDTAELADMLKDIGASLRGLDPDAADPRATAAPDLPQTDLPQTDLPQTGPEPPPVPGARRTPGDLPPPPGPPLGSPADDEAGLLEILGRMGPSAEERRTAARLMKRLFKGRAARRRNETDEAAD